MDMFPTVAWISVCKRCDAMHKQSWVSESISYFPILNQSVICILVLFCSLSSTFGFSQFSVLCKCLQKLSLDLFFEFSSWPLYAAPTPRKSMKRTLILFVPPSLSACRKALLVWLAAGSVAEPSKDASE